MKRMLVVLLLIGCLFSLSGCFGNSGNLTEGMTNASNTFNYVLTNEAGQRYLHEVHKWKDGESDALGISTKCCHNQFWTSYNVAILYTDRPKYLSDDVIMCKE